MSENEKKTFNDWVREYDSSADCHAKIINNFTKGTNSISWLKKHRDFVEYKSSLGRTWGHGARCLQYMWKIIVDEMPNNFKFLEIGVYKGQILSLIELCSKKANKNSKIVGVTPLFDKDFANYNRMPCIEVMYKSNSLEMKNTKIIDGLSQNKDVIKEVYNLGPYNLVYIDGDHSYQATVDDIVNFDKCLSKNGFMVVDDASNFKDIPPSASKFKGIIEVSEAVRDTLEKNSNYEEVLTCMHVRIFRKIGDKNER